MASGFDKVRHGAEGGELLYRLTRDVHLYLGLFISPFILLFAASVFFLNHAKLDPADQPSEARVAGLRLPDDMAARKSAALLEAAVDLLAQLGRTGEITLVRAVRPDGHFVFSFARPDLDATVDVDIASRTAVLRERPTGILEGVSYLHKMPGPHNVSIRGNWVWARLWSVFADVTVSLVLFLSVSGIYLWWTLKAERRIGLVLLSAGVATLSVLMYVTVR